MAKKTKKAKATKQTIDRAQYLFVQTAAEAQIEAQLDEHTLILTDVERTIYFSDRPLRLTGHESTTEFLKGWTEGKDSFEKNPPNAELVMFKRGKAESVTLTLSNPKWAQGKLSYTVSIIGDDAPRRAAGSPAALFIDSGSKIPDRIKKKILKMYNSKNLDAGQIAEKLKLSLGAVEKIIYG